MESMNFQKIVKDPIFKDIRYYNNYLYEYTGYDEEPFTSTAYKDLFEEYKKYTRTNKARTNKDTNTKEKDSNTKEIINIYNSLVEFSDPENNTLNFKTIRSKSMQDLNGNDIAKLFEITKKVIHIFFLKLSDWYLDQKTKYPSFYYAFPEEFATSKLSKIQYLPQKNIKELENKINEAQQSSDIDSYFITKNEEREKKISALVTKLEENIKKNHPFK